MKQGFTLVELIGTISLMSLLLVIIFPIVRDKIDESKESAYNDQISIIEAQAKTWSVENSDKLPQVGSDTFYTLTLEELLNSDLLSNEEIINPKTNKPMTGCVKIYYDSNYNQYMYNYKEECSA